MDVCNVGKGMNAFNASGRYEDIGIAQKGSMVMVLTRLDHTDVISVDIHLKNISDALSPSDFDTYLRYF